ncbi:hypothetical protein E2C01_037192 [Portunus trituberculatus]|uniref:Uncharacterized protein n=1 Tax=Portunus trituberculatus TaxID=210409 RepID=A0A5B7FEN0_PORTR|nr:hypothetical protein [Portunus trituberculatus]
MIPPYIFPRPFRDDQPVRKSTHPFTELVELVGFKSTDHAGTPHNTCLLIFLKFPIVAEKIYSFQCSKTQFLHLSTLHYLQTTIPSSSMIINYLPLLHWISTACPLLNL